MAAVLVILFGVVVFLALFVVINDMKYKAFSDDETVKDEKPKRTRKKKSS